MEIRRLTSEYERQVFAKCLSEARSTRGIGWKETLSSELGRAHILLGNLYALFENEGEPADRMVAGFIAHSLASFPQTLPKPDLSHLPARSIVEGSELWSLSKGMGRIAQHVSAAVAGILQAKAIVVYPMITPADLTTPYLQLGFIHASEPVLWPYAETIDGGEIFVQPLVLEGAKLEAYIRAGFDFLFNSAGSALRFSKPFAQRAPQPEAEAAELPPPALIAAARAGGDQHNGLASH